MFQLNILSGKMAGTISIARHFPFSVGRKADADLVTDEAGVWDKHLEFKFLPATGIQLYAHPEAKAVVNGQRVEEILLKNGDFIEIGALKMRFWLSETRPISQTFRELITWMGLAGLFVLQAAIIRWLLQ